MKPRELAAQCWCDPETEMIEMDARLAEAFAKRLKDKDARIASLEAEVNRLRKELDATSAESKKMRDTKREERLLKRIFLLRAGHQYNADADFRGNRSAESRRSFNCLAADDKMRGEG